MSHSVELISVGTELLLGNILNTDAKFLSEQLSALGLNVFYQTVVGDNPERLSAAVALARTRADIIITTGGLGPTCDDLTKETLASCFGLTLVYHSESAEHMRDYFEKGLHNCHMTENNLQQAYLPEGCTVFPNHWGTAPGCAFCADGVHVMMLPGPPSECQPMFLTWGVPYLRELSEGVILSRSLRLFGMGESAVEALLREKMNALQNPTLAPYAKEGEVELRITAKADSKTAAAALIAPVEAQVRALLGDKIYGADVSSMEEVVLQKLRHRGLTLGCAESCTGGLVAQRMTALPGASQVFRGGIVSYHSDVKRDVLGVPQALLDQYGAVSQPVAAAMAEGARRVLCCDLAVSVTGVAGPDRDDRDHPVGLVFLALASQGGTVTREVHLGTLRQRIRTAAANCAFDLVLQALSSQ